MGKASRRGTGMRARGSGHLPRGPLGFTRGESKQAHAMSSARDRQSDSGRASWNVSWWLLGDLGLGELLPGRPLLLTSQGTADMNPGE